MSETDYSAALAEIKYDEYGQPIEEQDAQVKTYAPSRPYTAHDLEVNRITVRNWRIAHGLTPEYEKPAPKPKVMMCGHCQHPVPAHKPDCKVRDCDCGAPAEGEGT